MAFVGIVAAGGRSTRTGLGQYTNKAALPVRGRTLLGHQVDFLRESGVDRALVIARPEHLRLLASLLSPTEMRRVALLASDCATGWAGEVERARAFVDDGDVVLLVSCDNLHKRSALPLGAHEDALFTYTSWARRDAGPTDGPILARGEDGDWVERSGRGFLGDFFSGYAVVRGGALFGALGALPFSPRGEKELTRLLAHLRRHARCAAVPYPGVYEDVADLRSLALLDAGEDPHDPAVEAILGAGVLLRDAGGRVLLTERQDGRGWVPPGGLVDRGEDFAHAAARELREEVGVALTEVDLRLLGVYPSRGKGGEAAVSVIFRARAPDADATVRPEPAEVRQARWFGREALDLSIPFNLDQAVRDVFDDREIDARVGGL